MIIKDLNLEVFQKRITTHGGSMRYYIQKKEIEKKLKQKY